MYTQHTHITILTLDLTMPSSYFLTFCEPLGPNNIENRTYCDQNIEQLNAVIINVYMKL